MCFISVFVFVFMCQFTYFLYDYFFCHVNIKLFYGLRPPHYFLSWPSLIHGWPHWPKWAHILPTRAHILSKETPPRDWEGPELEVSFYLNTKHKDKVFQMIIDVTTRLHTTKVQNSSFWHHAKHSSLVHQRLFLFFFKEHNFKLYLNITVKIME